MTDSVSERDIRDIVREIATLSADVRNFMATHEGMKSDINVLLAYGTALVTAGSIVWMLFGEKLKKIFGI